MQHNPVLLSEVISYLNIQDEGKYLDLTAGAGGHAEKILERINDSGKLILVDRDRDSVDFLSHKFENNKNVEIVKMNFADIKFDEHFDGILADLGVSSHQFDSKSRGFSYRFDSPLDFRMDQEENNRLKNLLSMNADEMARVIKDYSDEYQSLQVAKAVKKRFETGRMNTTFDLKSAIIEGKNNRDVKHGMKRVFMAFRIYVNDEIESLKTMIERVPNLLAQNGRFTIITYHSIEDRIVKEYFKACALTRPVEKKVVKPHYQEIYANKRARSAKLRIYERI